MEFNLLRILATVMSIISLAFPTVQSGGTLGKFDRFGKDRRTLLSDNKRNVGKFGSNGYYNHPDGAKIIKESHFETEYELGRKIVFLCTAMGNPRPHITWYKYDHRIKDGVELYAHHRMQIHEWVETEDQLKSKFEIDPATQMDIGDYECLADNKWAIDRRRFRTYYGDMD